MIEHLIFDCGGVLVYPRAGDWSLPIGMAEILGERARDVYTSRYLLAHQSAVGWLDESRLMRDAEDERRCRLEYLRAVDARMGWRLTPDELQRLADDFTDNMRRYGMFDDVPRWLMRWKERFSLGILSDAMPSLLGALKQFGIYDMFDAVVISTQVGAVKPGRAMFDAILAALDARPETCLFVDDRPCNVDGALAAGMRAIQMARPACLPASLWDGPVAASFEELDGMIEA